MDIPLPYVVAIISTLSATIAVLWRVNQSDLKKRITALERALIEKDKQIEKLWNKVNFLTGEASSVMGCTVKNCPVKVIAEDRTTRVPVPLRPSTFFGLLLILCQCSCVSYVKTQSREAMVGIGMDASEVRFASGASITGLNTSTAIKDGSQAIKDLTRMRLNTGIITSSIKAAQSISTTAIE
jgi:hypothetical protein